MPNRTIFIYCLTNPTTSEIKYVGKTVNLKLRYNGHCCTENTKGKNRNWIKSLLPLKPEMYVLEESDFNNWIEAEQFWIAYMKSLGAKLTNMTVGGEGASGLKPTASTLIKRSIALKGRKFSEEHRFKIKLANTGRKCSEKQKSEMSERAKGQQRHLGFKHTDEAKAKISKAGQNRICSEESKIKNSESHKGKLFSCEARANMSKAAKARGNNRPGYKHTSETIEKIRLNKIKRDELKRDKINLPINDIDW